MTPDATTTTRPSKSVPIPGVILDFLSRATIGIAGTRDANLVPRVRRVCGWRVEPDLRTMACAISRTSVPGLLESLRDNGEFTLTVEIIGSHETYQFKGAFVDVAHCSGDDLKTVEGLRDRFAQTVSRLFGVPDAACRSYIGRPGITVRFQVYEIFVQTPGPGAGRRLVPAEGR